MPRPKKIKVVYRKLGKEKVYGWCHDDFIEIDERIKGKKLLEILLHECLHFTFPEKSEAEITKAGVLITNTLWKEGIMPVQKDTSIPLQDGSL